MVNKFEICDILSGAGFSEISVSGCKPDSVYINVYAAIVKVDMEGEVLMLRTFEGLDRDGVIRVSNNIARYKDLIEDTSVTGNRPASKVRDDSFVYIEGLREIGSFFYGIVVFSLDDPDYELRKVDDVPSVDDLEKMFKL